MRITRRTLLASGTIVASLGAIGLAAQHLRRSAYSLASGLPVKPPEVTAVHGNMPYRRFGSTDLEVSEVGFGAWAIGGTAYGAVDHQDTLRALARAEELGCNLVDTAMVYGDSESVLGEFLRGRRSRWVVATKYSYQADGMAATLEKQLQRLGTDYVDFYQLHAPPQAADAARIFDELYALKKAGKARFIGISVYSARDIDDAIDHRRIDGVQLPLSLLDPDPFLQRVARLRQAGLAVLVRSTLKEGFLVGRFRRDAKFPDVNDQRHGWSAAQIARTVDAVERFRFLEGEAGSLLRAAVAYPLSFPEVSSVLLGTKTAAQADSNFGQIPGARLSTASLSRILAIQDETDAGGRRGLRAMVRRILGRA